MKFAIYSRKSKYTGRGESIGNQAELCRAYVQTHFGDVREEDFLLYEDEGFSGKNLERPQFKRLLGDADRGRFDCLVCYRLDRISRSVVDFSALVELFSKLRISLICIREQFDTTTPMGRAMMYIASVFAQLERETIAERVRDNMFLLAKEGRWLGGTPPFGFRSKKSETVILDGKRKSSFLLENCPEEGEIVQTIFRLFLAGNSLSQIKRVLDQKGYRTRGGNPFSLPGIRSLLGNPVYAAADSDGCRYLLENGASLGFCGTPEAKNGFLCYHKRSSISGTERQCPISEWVVARGKHQSLVSGREWADAQLLLKGREQQKRRGLHNSYALLSGLLYCGNCGEKLYAKPRSGRIDESFDYICKNKLHKKGCGCPNLNGKAADLLIAERFAVSPLLDEIIRRLSLLRREMKKAGDPPPEEDRGREELERLVEIGAVSPEEAEMLRSRIRKLRFPAPSPCRRWEERLPESGGWLPLLPLPEQRRLLSLLVERIEWDGTDLKLVCRPGAGECFSAPKVSFFETAHSRLLLR